MRCIREDAKGRACKPELERARGVERGKRNAMCARETAEGLGGRKQRRSVQDSERANLCKIVAQGGDRGKQACKGGVQEAGGLLCVLGRGEGGRTEGPGEGGKGY